MGQQTIVVDWGNLESIKRAEKKKSTLENKGYMLVDEKMVGLDKYKMVYERRGKR